MDNVMGDDSNLGTKDEPWRSLKRAQESLIQGDILKVVSNGPQHPYRETMVPKRSGIMGAVITIQGTDRDSLVYLTGSDDISDRQSGGTLSWEVSRDNTWIITDVPEIHGLWLSTSDEWINSGIQGMKKRTEVVNGTELDEGEWLYDEERRTISYKPFTDEVIENTHIEGIVRPNNVNIFGKHYIKLKNIVSVMTPSSAFGITDASTHVTLFNIRASQAYNGVSVGKGSSDITIENCKIDDISNNGIMVAGHPGQSTINTMIRGCEISNVKSNDCISLHKNGDQDDIGSNHIIKDNTLHDCAEQGIDITSGSDIIVRNNTTYNNGISGVMIGSEVHNVLVVGHSSNSDGSSVGSIVVGPSENVMVINSVFYNSKSRMVRVHNARNLIFKNNTFVVGQESNGLFVEVIEGSEDVRFRRNIFASVAEGKTGRNVQFVGHSPHASSIAFSNNIWWDKAKADKPFLVEGQGKFNRDELSSTYGLELTDTESDPGIRVSEDGTLKDAEAGYFWYGCDCDLQEVVAL